MPVDPRDRISLRLLDGHEVVVRPIATGDKQALVRAFERLSEQSRYQRFLTGIQELSETELAYLTEIDHRDHEALIAFDAAAPEEAVGVARFVRVPDSTAAEAAVTVIDDWQGRGLGTALCNLLAERARAVGIDRFTALLLTDNTQMQDVLSSLGPAKVLSREAGTIGIEVALPEQGIGDHMAGVLRVAAGGTIELATPPWGLRQVESRGGSA